MTISSDTGEHGLVIGPSCEGFSIEEGAAVYKFGADGAALAAGISIGYRLD
jgi:hypothetical protein